MKHSIGFRLSAAICVVVLFLAALSLLPISVQADKAEDAIKEAEKAVKAAEGLGKAADDAKKAAAKAADDAKKAAKNGGPDAKKAADDDAKETDEDKAADKAADAADKAAEAADKAQDEAAKQQQEADDAAEAAKKAGNDKEKNDEAAKQEEEAKDAARDAKDKEDDAAKAEDESNEADKKADEADKKIKNRKVKEEKAKARRLRKAARAARRAAAKKIREARKLLHDRKKREGANPTDATEALEKLLEELSNRLNPQGESEKPPKQRTVIPSGAGGAPQTKTANGLHIVTFDTLPGRVTVILPDDMRAGDTISGTVIAEPKGQTKEERAQSQSELSGLVIEIDGKPVEPFPTTPQERESVIQQTFWIYHADEPKVKLGPNAQPTPHPVPISVTNSQGKDLAHTTIPMGVAPGQPDLVIPTTFNIPPLGQTGRPIVITGPFDGNSSNTTLNASASRTTLQDFEKNTENVAGGIGLLAESRGKAFLSSPENVIGPIEITVNEGNQQTTGTYRNVAVNLTAPKTTLRKGEKTKLLVLVSGLKGIQAPVPLTLESGGVITMEGGTNQPLVIQPSQVGADGRYSTTREITGVQAGGWSATATVVTDRSGVVNAGNTPAQPPMMAPIYPNEEDMDPINSVDDLKEALNKRGLRKGDEATCQRLMDTKVALCTRYKNSTDTATKDYLEKKYQIVRQVLIDYSCGQTLPATLAGCP